MRFSSFALVATAAPLVRGVQTFYELLAAQGTIGSHFGTPSVNASYDYVIVGGGTAGLTIAARLAQNTSYTVAVVEGGSFYEITNGNNSQIPASGALFVGKDPALRNPQVDWDIISEPIAGYGGRDMLYTSGKALGGSSARNYLLYQRSAASAYQKWADDVDDQSYTFDNLFPYMQKSVHFEPPSGEGRLANATPKYNESAFSPSGEPLVVSYPNFATSYGTWVRDGLEELGFKDTLGFTSGDILGYSYIANTLDGATQTRMSSETSFLRQALLLETNLNVYQSALAKKILFNKNKQATGVLVNSGWKDYQLNATKEVIVCSGALRSPQMLLVSGIGPEETLKKYDIPVVANRPGVGQGLQDHVAAGSANAVKIITFSSLSTNPAYAIEQLELYQANRTGALTSIGGDIIAFEKVPQNLRATLKQETLDGLDANPAGWPDWELFFSAAYAGNNEDFTGTIPPNPFEQYAEAEVALVAPFSKGNVTISSADTAVNPVVNLNYLSDPRDKDLIIAGLKRCREFWNTTTLQKITFGHEAYPGLNYSTDAEILEAIETASVPLYHAAATNRMGLKTDNMAVVDSHARVIGVENLRVVDASSMPFLPPGHPQGTIYTFAEKIADEINRGL